MCWRFKEYQLFITRRLLVFIIYAKVPQNENILTAQVFVDADLFRDFNARSIFPVGGLYMLQIMTFLELGMTTRNHCASRFDVESESSGKF